MAVRVMRAEYLGEYRIHLRFTDGAEGDVDLSAELHGEVFDCDTFRIKSTFAKVRQSLARRESRADM